MAGQDALGREYLLHEQIGSGSLAVVRRASRRSGGPALAAKLMRPELAGDRRVRTLFLREETALRAVDHPGIVQFHDLVVEGGTLALLMDFVDGPDLRRHLADSGGRLSPAETATILAQVADALDAAHARGVVHLDLKPENLLLVRGSDPPEIRVTDFGVAALLMDADRGAAGGTPGYTAPEIWQGAPPTAAADVYSLGVLLVELVTGDLQGDPEALPPELAGPARSCLNPVPAQRPTARRVAAYLHGVVASGALGELRPADQGRLPTVRRPEPTGPWAGAFPPALSHPASSRVAPSQPTASQSAASQPAPSQGVPSRPAPPAALSAWPGRPDRASAPAGPGGEASAPTGWLAGAPAPAGWLAGSPPPAGRPVATPAPNGQFAWGAGFAGPPGGTPQAAPPAGEPRRRRRRGPLVALGVVVAIAATLIGVNLAVAADRRADDRKAALAGATATPSPTGASSATGAAGAAGAAGPGATLPTEPVRTGTTTTAAPAPVRITLAGHVADGAGTLAISIRDQQAIAYICDGSKVEAWLKGTAKDGKLDLTGKAGAKVVGTFDTASARGRVTVIGKTHDFVLGIVKKPSGLYRTTTKVRNAQVKGSWIVLPDGRQVGVLTEGEQTGPAPQLDVTNRTTSIDGTSVPVTAVDVDTGTGF
ncbi:protein kinase [Actinoplanes sp. NPDC020271]|uniref:serine/threonine-protein kinase n=1 Tax=Actinoplanes sp. NPDC020271 TaxID=3363896 RepID=UPI0037A975E8